MIVSITVALFMSAFPPLISTVIAPARASAATSTPQAPVLGVNQAAYQSQDFLYNLSNSYGVGWSREGVSIGPYWTSAVYQPLLSAHINILGVLGSELFQNNSWTLSNWETAVSLATAKYPLIHVWEIWNEPDLVGFQSGYENGSAYNYYMMMKTAYQIIKSHDSSDTVLGLGGLNVFSYKSADTEAYQWAQKVWSYGAVNYSDAISLHVYSSDMYLMTDAPNVPGPTVGQMISAQLDEYAYLTGKPVWITEIGIPSNNGTGVSIQLNNSLAKQALFLNQTYSLLLSKSYIRAIMWFNTIGLSPFHNYDFALFISSTATTDYPKPVMDAYENFQRNLSSGVSFVSSSSTTNSSQSSTSALTSTSKTLAAPAIQINPLTINLAIGGGTAQVTLSNWSPNEQVNVVAVNQNGAASGKWSVTTNSLGVAAYGMKVTSSNHWVSGTYTFTGKDPSGQTARGVLTVVSSMPVASATIQAKYSTVAQCAPDYVTITAVDSSGNIIQGATWSLTQVGPGGTVYNLGSGTKSASGTSTIQLNMPCINAGTYTYYAQVSSGGVEVSSNKVTITT